MDTWGHKTIIDIGLGHKSPGTTRRILGTELIIENIWPDVIVEKSILVPELCIREVVERQKLLEIIKERWWKFFWLNFKENTYWKAQCTKDREYCAE